jgi:hypothetical protein
MPFVNELGLWSSGARVSWRGARRFGKNDGKPIEDFGIKSDRIIRPVVQDFIPGSSTQTQFDYISAELEKESISSGKKYFQMRVLRELATDLQIGEAVTIDFELQGIKKVTVNFENEGVVASLDISNSELSRLQARQITFESSTTKSLDRKIEIKGYNLSNQLVFVAYRDIRFLPIVSDYLKIAPGKNVDLIAYQGNAVVQFDSLTPQGEGWAKNGTSLQIGKGIQYVDSVDSMYSIFINSEAPFKLNVKAQVQTEEDYDFFLIGYKSPNNVTQLLGDFGLSGNVLVDSSFDINTKGLIELFVKFKSDGAITDVGVTVASLSITA